MRRRIIIAGIASAAALSNASASCLEPLSFLVGEWRGDETGVSGSGQGSRTYEFVLDGRYLHARNTSRFEPQEKNPKGETHRDWQFFSCDTINGRVVLREFHSEGYVNQYVLRDASGEAGTTTFESTALENSPPGTRAMLTIRKTSDRSFTETFSLAFPSKDFSQLLENTWTKTR